MCMCIKKKCKVYKASKYGAVVVASINEAGIKHCNNCCLQML